MQIVGMCSSNSHVKSYTPSLLISPPILLGQLYYYLNGSMGILISNRFDEHLSVCTVTPGAPNGYQFCTGGVCTSDNNSKLIPYYSRMETDLIYTLKYFLSDNLKTNIDVFKGQR